MGFNFLRLPLLHRRVDDTGLEIDDQQVARHRWFSLVGLDLARSAIERSWQTILDICVADTLGRTPAEHSRGTLPDRHGPPVARRPYSLKRSSCQGSAL